MPFATAGAFVSPVRISFAPSSLVGVEWTQEIRACNGDGSNFRVNFVYAPSGKFLTNTASFNDLGTGTRYGWSSGHDLYTLSAFTKVWLWDNSAGGYSDITSVASSETVNDIPLPDQAADFLYCGSDVARENPSIYFKNVGGTVGVGGGPLIVEYSTAGGWASATNLIDTSTAFTAITTGSIDFNVGTDWAARDVNGSTKFWIRVRLTANASTPAVGSRILAHWAIDGVQLLASTVPPPNYRTFVQNTDAIAGTSLITDEEEALVLPQTIRFRAMQIAAGVINPVGISWESGQTGITQPLLNGNDGQGYAIWRVSNEYNGVWTDVADYWEPMEFLATIDHTNPISFGPEFVSYYPDSGSHFGDAITNDIRYSDLRVFDGTRWTELTEWKIHAVNSWSTDPDYGWSVSATTGKLASIVGVPGERTVDRYLLSGLTYERADSFTSLAFVSVQNIGSQSYNGPAWWRGGTNVYPYVQQNADLGFLVLHPDATIPVCASYVAPVAGSFRFVGDFCRVSSENGFGNGVDVSVVAAGATLFSTTISAAHSVDVGNPFAGTSNVTFDETVALSAGEICRFVVLPRGGDHSFTATGFRVTISFVPDAVQPGGGDLQATVFTTDRMQWKGPDLLLGWNEPDFSAEWNPPDETAGVSSGLDPLVKSFDVQMFDPETGTELRTERDYTAREYRYTRSMNADDQARVFGRGPYRKIGARVRMQSVTNRTSAWNTIAAENPLPALPGTMTLTSTPGDGSKALDAVVHGKVEPALSKADSDFKCFAWYASTTNGFAPSPSNFKGLSAVGSNSISFPAPSGTRVYVRCGALDEFHPQPELIADPETEIALLAQQYVDTIDAASLPIDTDGIVPGAITDMATRSTGPWPQKVSVNAKGGPVAIHASGSCITSGSGLGMSLTIRVNRRYNFDAVLWYSGSAYIDQTSEAASLTGSADLNLPESTSHVLYLGNQFTFGSDPASVLFDLVDDLSNTSVIVVEYWNGNAWTPVSGLTWNAAENFWDFGPFTGLVGIHWTMPNDWQAADVNFVGPYYWVRLRQTVTQTTANPRLRSAYVEYSLPGSAGSGVSVQSQNVETRFLSHGIHTAITSETKDIEEIVVTFSSSATIVSSALEMHAGKR